MQCSYFQVTVVPIEILMQLIVRNIIMIDTNCLMIHVNIKAVETVI